MMLAGRNRSNSGGTRRGAQAPGASSQTSGCWRRKRDSDREDYRSLWGRDDVPKGAPCGYPPAFQVSRKNVPCRCRASRVPLVQAIVRWARRLSPRAFFLTLGRRHGRTQKLWSCFVDVFAGQNRNSGKLFEAKIGVDVKLDSIEQLAVILRLLVCLPHDGPQPILDPVDSLFVGPVSSLSTKTQTFVERLLCGTRGGPR